MSDLISKLNVLVRASLNATTSTDKTRRIPAERLGKDIDSEIAALRQHIEEALNSEDTMQKRLNDANAQTEALDHKADAALLDGDDAQARALVQQLQRQQQRAAQLATDLNEHRDATSELIERVNTLEAMVSDARSTQSTSSEPLTPAELRSATDTSDSNADRAPGAMLSNLLRDARERAHQSAAPLPSATSTPTPPAPLSTTEGRSVPITIHRDTPNPTQSPTSGSPPAQLPSAPTANVPVKAADAASVDDDLARRRSRLSAPGS